MVIAIMTIWYIHCIKSQPPASGQLHSGRTLTAQQHTQEHFSWGKKTFPFPVSNFKD